LVTGASPSLPTFRGIYEKTSRHP
ncbi:icd protein, partial [Escherichia coli]|nr:icd protein [Escherichia coli]